MNLVSSVGSLLLVTTPLFGQSAAVLDQSPSVTLTNGQLKAKIYLPDPQRGFYHSTRFDWSGFIGALDYKGHSYYGDWFSRLDTDPKYWDLNYDGNEIVSAPQTAGVGPVEEFQTNGIALGYNEAKPGETFIKIGVGVLRRVDDRRYSHSDSYPLVNTGKWTVTHTKNSITFNQVLADSQSGYSYDYTKTIRLIPGKPQMIIDHRLKNTGTKAISTQVYDHNFLVLDHQPPGPDFVIKFPFQPTVTRPVSPGLGELRTNQIAYLKTLEGKDRMQAQMKGFSDNPSDYSISIENTKVGAGVRYSGNRPLWNVGYWSIRSVLAAEPFINIDIAPGSEYTWTLTYDLPAAT
jgi:hypothetical protein